MPLKGTLSGNYTSYINLSDGNYANPVTVTGTISLVSPTVALAASSAWSVFNAGSILSPGTSPAIGVVLGAGGYVDNRSGGVIEAYVGVSVSGSGTIVNQAGAIIAGSGGGVLFNNRVHAAEMVVNAGIISGGGAVGVYLAGYEGMLTNTGAGLISGGLAAISGRLGMVVNAATITGNYGVKLFAGGSIDNQAGGTILVTGNVIYGRYGDLQVYNAGTIANADTQNNPALYRPAILGFDIGAVTNAAGGVIDSQYQGIAGQASTLLNAGTVNTRDVAFNGNAVSNAAGGFITSHSTLAVYADTTVINAGTIAAADADATAVQFRTAGNYAASFVRLVVDPGAVFIGNVNGGNTTAATMELAPGSGTIAGFGSSFANFGTVQFDAGAAWTVSGAATAVAAPAFGGFARGDAIGLQGVAETIAGFAHGTLSLGGTTPLDLLMTGGFVTAEFAATETAGNTEIAFTQSGTLGGSTANGITLTQNPAIVTGTIDAAGGAALTGAAPTLWTVGNLGVIETSATAGSDARLGAGGTVANAAQATIAGGQYGVSIAGGAGTVLNAGRIAGATAVRLAAGYADRVVIYPGAVFAGAVDGGNAPGGSVASTLELARGIGPGTLNALGSAYVDFGQVTIDAGATWTFSGSNSLAAGDTLAIGGAVYAEDLVNAGSIAGYLHILTGGTAFSNAATGMVSAAGAAVVFDGLVLPTMVNAGTIVAGGRGADLGTNGTLVNAAGATIASGADDAVALEEGVIDNAGLLSTNGTFAAVVIGGALTNEASGTITGAAWGVSFGGASATNAGTIIASGGSGTAFLLEGGPFLSGNYALTNAGAGLISGGKEGVEFAEGGTLVNAASIAGRYGVVFANGGTVANGGRIAGSTTGVQLSGGSVTNASGGTIAGGSFGVAGGTNPITLDNAGTIAASGTSGVGIYARNGGTITNESGGTISGVTAVYLAAGGRVIADVGAVFDGQINGGLGGVSVLQLHGGATMSGMGTSIVNFSTIQFDSGPGKIGGSAAGLNNTTFNGFIPGDTIEITNASDGTIAGLSGGTLSVTGSDPVSLVVGAAFPVTDYHAAVVGGDTDITVACFAGGARILTAAGEVPVADLRVGERVATLGGRLARIVWLGQRRIDCRRARPADARPIRVCAGGFGDGWPTRDLVLSPDHAVFAGGVLVPVRHLVNGMTVVREPAAALTYFHIELTTHAVVLAEGLPCESYLDTGNRAAFDSSSAPGVLDSGLRRNDG